MKTIISWIFIIVVIIAGVLVYKHHSDVPYDTSTQTASTTDTGALHNEVSYFCTEGSFSTLYTDSNALLTFGDNTTLSLAQAVSGSGTRYEGSGAVLTTKGNDATLMENGKTAYSNCIGGTTNASGTGMTAFTDGSKTFTFSFPSTFTLSGGEIGYTQGWSNNATTSGLVLAIVTTPQNYMPKTNFSETKLTVGVSSDPSAIAMCTTSTNGEKSGGTTVINGVTFSKFTLGDAGAGNLYDTTSYRTIRDGECYSVAYTIHSTQLGNYPPELGMTQFDKAKIQSAFDGIVQSFRFSAQS